MPLIGIRHVGVHLRSSARHDDRVQRANIGEQRLLVVDDEHSIVDAVSTALRYEGFTVETAMSGRSALAAVQEREFDLIVLDVMLPDVDGFEVASRLRADGIETPILFLTARTGLDDKAAGFGVGADDYVTKPFSLAEIVMRVRAILRRADGARDGVSGRRNCATPMSS